MARTLKKIINGESTDRELNTALYMLRAFQMGLTVSDMEQIPMGLILDMITEESNDYADYDRVPTQEDFDAF